MNRYVALALWETALEDCGVEEGDITVHRDALRGYTRFRMEWVSPDKQILGGDLSIDDLLFQHASLSPEQLIRLHAERLVQALIGHLAQHPEMV